MLANQKLLIETMQACHRPEKLLVFPFCLLRAAKKAFVDQFIRMEGYSTRKGPAKIRQRSSCVKASGNVKPRHSAYFFSIRKSAKASRKQKVRCYRVAPSRVTKNNPAIILVPILNIFIQHTHVYTKALIGKPNVLRECFPKVFLEENACAKQVVWSREHGESNAKAQ